MLSFLKETSFEMSLLLWVPQSFESCSENDINGVCNILPLLLTMHQSLVFNVCPLLVIVTAPRSSVESEVEYSRRGGKNM